MDLLVGWLGRLLTVWMWGAEWGQSGAGNGGGGAAAAASFPRIIKALSNALGSSRDAAGTCVEAAPGKQPHKHRNRWRRLKLSTVIMTTPRSEIDAAARAGNNGFFRAEG